VQFGANLHKTPTYSQRSSSSLSCSEASKAALNTTVVDSGMVLHHAPDGEGGLDVTYGGPEDGEIVAEDHEVLREGS
jgi:hypothetical protein